MIDNPLTNILIRPNVISPEGLKEMVEDKKTGIQFQSRDIELFYKSIQTAISLPSEEVMKIKNNAQHLVNDKYNIEIIASRFNSYYADRS